MKGTLLASTLAGFAASLCCIGPALVLLFGSTTLGAFSFFEPVRPYTSILAIGTLGFAHVRMYRRNKVDACCDPHEEEAMKKDRIQKRALWGITPVVVALILFPYFGSYLYAGGEKERVDKGLDQAEWTIEGMTCQWCAKGLEGGMSRVDGVSECMVDYETGSMVLTFDRKVVSPDDIPNLVKRMGYTAIPVDGKQQQVDKVKTAQPNEKKASR